jgi:putative addiction module killer protein
VYYGLEGDAIIILLAGGDKNSQTSDVQKAKRYWKGWKRRQR